MASISKIKIGSDEREIWAVRLKTASTIKLTGSVTGSISFDGSGGDVVINTSTNHTHSYLPLSGGTLTGNPTVNKKGARYIATNGTNSVWFGINETGTAWGIYDATNEKYLIQSDGTNIKLNGNAATATKVNKALTVKLNGGTTEGTNMFTFDGSAEKVVNITPSSIGAAASSHGTHVSYGASATAVGTTASAGTASTVSRSDHVHNLTKATVVAALGYTPPTSNTTYSAGAGLALDGTTFKHSNSVTAATASGSATKTLTFGGTFALPTVSYDAQGHVTGSGTTTMTMPSDRLFVTLVPTGTSIPANADLNTTTYMKVGRYFCSQTANAKTLQNCPVDVAFMMEVYSPLSTTIDNETTGTWVYRIRKITAYNTGMQFIQYASVGNTANAWTYGAWKVQPIANFTLDTSDKNGGSALTGSTTKPIYLKADGTFAACTYSLNTDVPSDAKFTDTVYTHPTTSGNKHIPSGGSSGQILRWSADGTAVWGDDKNTTYSVVTSAANGLVPMFDAADGTIDSSSTDWVLTNNNGSIGWYKLPANAFKNDNTNYYHTPSYTAGLKVATGTGVDDLYIPTGTTSSLGVVKQHTATDCTTYTSDDGATTPAAVKKAFTLFGAKNGIFYVAGNTSGTAGTWTGTNTEIPSLFTGLTIAYKIGIAGASATTLNLTTAAGASGAKTVRRNTGALTTHLGVGSIVHLTYDGTYWVWADYDSNTKNTTGSSDTSSKIFLVGATSQASSATTYSHDTVYVGTDGCLYSNGTKVSVTGHTHTVTYKKASTATANATATGTISAPTFTGTAHNHTFTGAEHNHTLTPTTATIKQVDSVGTMFAASVEGEVLILTPGSTPTTANVTVYTGLTIAKATQGGTIANTTATGTVSAPTFTGTAHSHSITLTDTTVTSST